MDCSLRRYLWYSTDVLRAVTEDNGEPLGASEPPPPQEASAVTAAAEGRMGRNVQADGCPLPAEWIMHQGTLCMSGICAI